MYRLATLAIDVDEVIAQLVPTWVGELRRRHPECPDPHTPAWTSWQVTDQIPEKYHDILFEILDEPTLYDTVEPVPGALEGIQALRAMNYRTVFVTSASNGHAGAKLRWLVKHGFLDTHKFQRDYVECYDKTLIYADMILDDRPRTCHDFVKEHGVGRALLYMPRYLAPECRTGLPFVTNWGAVPTLIQKQFSQYGL
jgi:5'(3')-deoxyribonucleotidase